MYPTDHLPGFIQFRRPIANGVLMLALLALLGRPSTSVGQTDAAPSPGSLISAARQGDLAGVDAALKAGVDVDAKTDYGATALFFACDRGNEAIVERLLEAGADPNTKDSFYNATPVTWAQSKGHTKILLRLFAAGGEGADAFLKQAVLQNNLETARTILEQCKLSPETLLETQALVANAEDSTRTTLLAALESLDVPAWKPPAALDPSERQLLAGRFADDRVVLTLKAEDSGLTGSFNEGPFSKLVPLDTNRFMLNTSRLAIQRDGEHVEAIELSIGPRTIRLLPQPEMPPSNVADANETEPAAVAESAAPFVSSDLNVSSPNWPGFRGTGARGIADGQSAPVHWNGVSSESQPIAGLKWKTPIDGLGLSCPVIWEDRVLITTAATDGQNDGLKIGLYGDVDSIEDEREYRFEVICLSRESGEVLWKQTARQARPAVKRHAKSSHANPTIATDGTHVVAFFGSEGLYCYDMQGNLLWTADFGLLDSGWFYDPGYQWGFGSSPVIDRDHVVVQCDVQGQSFLTALNLTDGTPIWRTERDEIPTWSTPTVHDFGGVTMVITNGTKAARGYDADTGKLLWSLSGNSEIVVPTPMVAHNLIYLASGYSPVQPIYAVRPTAQGDLQQPDDAETPVEHVAWSLKRGGPYMPSPLVYGDYLYCCSNSGILTCYEAKTGTEVYKQRLRAPGGSLSFTASPLAADGRLYLTAEDGRVLLVQAGPEFALVGVNACGESTLATPAISQGAIYLRTQGHLMAFENAEEKGSHEASGDGR